MRTLLHVLTKPDDALAQQVVAEQTRSKTNKVEVVDLTQWEPDYAALLEKIFAADSVAVW